MICTDCGRDVIAYTALGIVGPAEHECPGELVYIRRRERDRLRDLATLTRDHLVPIVEMDNEANDPSTDLYVVIHQVKALLESVPLPGEGEGR